jgi:hypothetical protein
MIHLEKLAQATAGAQINAATAQESERRHPPLDLNRQCNFESQSRRETLNRTVFPRVCTHKHQRKTRSLALGLYRDDMLVVVSADLQLD